MGIIKRQSLKNSIVNYVGLGIGAISTLWIYSRDTETYGIAQFLIKMAAILVPLATWGAIGLSIRFFPDFKAKYKTPAPFLGFLLGILAITLPLFYGFTLVFEEQIYALLGRIGFKVEVYEAYGRYGFILCIIWSLMLELSDVSRTLSRMY